MRGRRSLRARMALLWGGGFFAFGALILIAGSLLIRDRIADDPAEVINGVVGELGLQVDDVADLDVMDPAGNTVTGDQIIAVVQDVVDSTRADIAISIWLVLLMLATVAAAAGWWLAGRATRPIIAISELARHTSSERLGHRIAYAGPNDELRDLADAFDSMLERLEHAFLAQRQFAASASHELRTPLTLIRTELDVALDTPDPSAAELETMADGIRSAISRSEDVINSLLLLARTGIVEPNATVNLTEVVEQVLDDSAMAIAERDITVRPSIAKGIAIRCDGPLIERMVGNLVANAVIHNKTGGSIEVELRLAETEAVFRIANTGLVLEASVAARLGEPFFRGAADRHGTLGTGLGLAIARSIAEAHGGHILIERREGGGVVATATLPTHAKRSAVRPPSSANRAE